MNKEEFESRVTKNGNEKGCWIWNLSIGSHGYGDLWVDKTHYLAHRFSYMLYCGEITEGLWVLHKCDIRACVNPEHLFLGTRQDNIDDAVSKGRVTGGKGIRNGRHTHPERTARGERQGRAKLTEEKVIKIREMYRNGESTTKLSKIYGVTRWLIRQIVAHALWKHVP